MQGQQTIDEEENSRLLEVKLTIGQLNDGFFFEADCGISHVANAIVGADKNIQRGDIITAIEGRPVLNRTEMSEVLAERVHVLRRTFKQQHPQLANLLSTTATGDQAAEAKLKVREFLQNSEVVVEIMKKRPEAEPASPEDEVVSPLGPAGLTKSWDGSHSAMNSSSRRISVVACSLDPAPGGLRRSVGETTLPYVDPIVEHQQSPSSNDVLAHSVDSCDDDPCMPTVVRTPKHLSPSAGPTGLVDLITPPATPTPLSAHSSFSGYHPGASNRFQQQDVKPSIGKTLRAGANTHVAILLCDPEVSPLAEIEALAQLEELEPPTTIDFGMKLRIRITDAQLATTLRETLRERRWLVITRVSACLRLASVLASLLEEARNNNYEGVHPDSRVILVTEPHPHFPRSLARGSPTLKLSASLALETEKFLLSSLSKSETKLNVLRDQLFDDEEEAHDESSISRSLASTNPEVTTRRRATSGVRFLDHEEPNAASPQSDMSPVVPQIPNSTTIISPPGSTQAKPNTLAPSALSKPPHSHHPRHTKVNASSAPASTGHNRVRISSSLTVVDIESRQVFNIDTENIFNTTDSTDTTTTTPPAEPTASDTTEQPPPNQSSKTIGSLCLEHVCAAMKGDKFFSLSTAGAPRRYAIGSSLGNVYIVDHKGSGLLSTHIHDACIWDIDFTTTTSFVSGAEDFSASTWEISPTNTVQRRTSTKFSCDVYCAKFSRSGDVIGVGGLSPKFTVRSVQTRANFSVTLDSSIQALAAVHRNSFICGTSNGSMALVDCERQETVATWDQVHSKKIPTLAAPSEANHIVSGSFDGCIKVWDSRQAAVQPEQTIRLKHYITGLAQDNGHYIAVCAGEALFVFDQRKPDAVLGGCGQAWSGLSRGVCIDSGDESIVTASPDGVIRYWSFGGN